MQKPYSSQGLQILPQAQALAALLISQQCDRPFWENIPELVNSILGCLLPCSDKKTFIPCSTFESLEWMEENVPCKSLSVKPEWLPTL